MNEKSVIELMETSQSAKEWDSNCDKVKEACNGYPPFWWASIIQSGRADQIMARWEHLPGITITTFP